MSQRLSNTLARLKDEGRAGFVPFIMAGDPSLDISSEILRQLPAHGADIIELGMPFSDPMADGPAIQAAGIRALKVGTKLDHIFEMVRNFRQHDDSTPIILMGYFNPLYHRGVDSFAKTAAEAGVDGVIIVDVPLEESSALEAPLAQNQLDWVRLIAPTSLEKRVTPITEKASGFVYYIAIKGVTGTASADYSALAKDIAHIRTHTNLPVAVGFGIKTPDDVASAANTGADLVVVGSSIVNAIADNPTADAQTIIRTVLDQCRALADGLSKRK